MTVAPVCRVGDQLNLTCSTATVTESIQFIEWNILLFNEQGTLEEISAFRNSRDASQQVTQRIVNSTTFTFMRISAQNAASLISLLNIDSVSIALNGIVVHCMEVENSMTSASTTIHIIDINNSKLTINFLSSFSYNVFLL